MEYNSNVPRGTGEDIQLSTFIRASLQCGWKLEPLFPFFYAVVLVSSYNNFFSTTVYFVDDNT